MFVLGKSSFLFKITQITHLDSPVMKQQPRKKDLKKSIVNIKLSLHATCACRFSQKVEEDVRFLGTGVLAVMRYGT